MRTKSNSYTGFDMVELHSSTGKSALSPRQIGAITLGNALEIYDFVLYGFLASTLARQFFPADDPLSSLFAAFMVFGAGFVMRPVGAVLLGRYADKYGRLAALQLSIVLMGLGTLVFVLAPTYAQIGAWAGVILVLGRLLQGFSMGGEISASSVALLEGGEANKACGRLSWQFASQGGGSALAALVVLSLGQAMPPHVFADWGWRLAFALGLLIVPTIWMMRRTLVMTESKAGQATDSAQIWSYRQELFWGALLITGSTASVYLMLNFLPVYLAEQQGWPKVIGQSAALLASLVILCASPVFGRLADKLASRQQMIRYALAAAALLVPVLFACILSGQIRWLLLPLVSIYMLTTVALTVAGLALMMESFPPSCRALGTGICYSLGVTLFGGFSAAIVIKLMALTANAWVPAIYLLLALGVSWLAAGRLSARRSAGQPALPAGATA